jgi:subtilisin family serine protease
VRYVSDDILVRLAPGVDARAFAKAKQLRDEPQSIERLGTLPIYRFKIADGDTPPAKAFKLNADPRVIYAEPNYQTQLPEARQRSSWVVGDASGYQEQWAPEQLRLAEAHAISEGAGIIVAVLDTGVDTQHPLLRDRLLSGYDFVDGDADPSEEGTYGVDAAYGHGTHVAGLIALAAPAVQILPLRTLDTGGVGTIWGQVEALRYAVDHGATVINLSYSFALPSLALADMLSRVTCSRGADAVCQSATQPGAVVVAAAGNSGLSIPEYPAGSNAPGVVAVGATTAASTIAPFSNYGSWVQVAAPGDGVVSSIPGGGYAAWSGTSMATPLAAGTVALIRAHFPELRPSEAVAQLKTTSDPLRLSIRRRVDAVNALTIVRP